MTSLKQPAAHGGAAGAPEGANTNSEMHSSTKLTGGGNAGDAKPEAAHAGLALLRSALPPELQSKLENAYESILIQALSADPALEPFLPPLEMISSAELLAKPLKEPLWIVPDLLPGGLAILAGRPKVGKSWLALQIGLAVVTGGEFFGRKIERGRVLYLALEDHERRLQSRMNLQGWPRDIAEADFILADKFREQIQHLNSGGGSRLAKRIQTGGYRLVIVDTLSRALKGDQKDESDMTAAIAPLQETALAQEIAIVLIDHHKKPMGAADPNPIDDILGSTAKGAVADAAWGLYKEQGKRGAKLAIIGRDVDEVTLKVSFDPATCRWQCEGEAQELELTERRQEVLDGLKLLGRAQVGELAEAIGQPKSHTFTRLQDLVNIGRILRAEEGKKVFYALPEAKQT